LAAMVRPAGMYIIFPLVIFFAVYSILQRYSIRKIILIIAVLLLPWLVLIESWKLRNYIAVQHYHFSSVQGIGLLYSLGADILADKEGISREEAIQTLQTRHAAPTNWIAASGKNFSIFGKKLILSNPHIFIRNQIIGLVRLFLISGEGTTLSLFGFHTPERGAFGDILRLSPSQYFQKWLIENPHFFLIFMITSAFLIFLYVMLIPAVNLIRRVSFNTPWPHLFLSVYAIYFTLTVPGLWTYYRFRTPFMGIICIYSAAGFCEIGRKYLHSRTTIGKKN